MIFDDLQRKKAVFGVFGGFKIAEPTWDHPAHQYRYIPDQMMCGKITRAIFRPNQVHKALVFGKSVL
jgi:hypothetical protein